MDYKEMNQIAEKIEESQNQLKESFALFLEKWKKETEGFQFDGNKRIKLFSIMDESQYFERVYTLSLGDDYIDWYFYYGDYSEEAKTLPDITPALIAKLFSPEIDIIGKIVEFFQRLKVKIKENNSLNKEISDVIERLAKK